MTLTQSKVERSRALDSHDLLRCSQGGEARKGSQYQLQQWVCSKRGELERELRAASPSLESFGGQWNWLSPIKETDYREYRDDFLDVLGYPDYEKELRAFWPKQGPQWDGLVKIDAGKKQGVLLIEAKSHIGEMKSDCKAEDPKSLELIAQSIESTQKYLRVDACHDWSHSFYQMANRLVMLHFMNALLKIPAWLALICFVNDETIETPTTKEQWEGAIQALHIAFGLPKRHRLTERLIHVFPEAIKHK